jgi:NAD(P)-dependent dehydrogenase (short-subunit alcohol dehydrogenase family)
MSKLSDKVAVITGGSTGIGFATARLFIDEGAKVVITGRTKETLDAAAKELGPNARAIVSDATNLKDLERTFAEIQKVHGRIDVLFVNAGGATFRPLEAEDEEHFDAIMDQNVKSAYFTIQKALPLLARGSTIVLNTSVVLHKGFPSTSVYSAAKAAVRQFGRTLAAELAERGIRVNAVSPGPIDTPIYDKLGLGAGKQGFVDSMTALVPMKRFGRAEEVAKVALFLGSEDSSYLTGEEILVDGGIANL